MTAHGGRVRWALRFASIALVTALVSCAPQAIFFHESTKVGVAATYNVSDSQPLSSHFGYKRRIVAVVPGQERVPAANGKEQDATNQGDALSLVSKFYVKVGTRAEGIEIRNNFATGNAARALTASSNSSRAVEALMHNQVVVSPPARDSMASSESASTSEIKRIQSRRTKPPSTSTTREITTQSTTTPVLPKSSETTEPSPATTPSPALRDASSDSVPTNKPVATPTLPPARREIGADGIIRPKPTPEVGPDGTTKPKPDQ